MCSITPHGLYFEMKVLISTLFSYMLAIWFFRSRNPVIRKRSLISSDRRVLILANLRFCFCASRQNRLNGNFPRGTDGIRAI